jgi:hypothetical protein
MLAKRNKTPYATLQYMNIFKEFACCSSNHASAISTPDAEPFHGSPF